MSRKSLDQLYGEVILDHQRDPRNFEIPSCCSFQEKGMNPVCGDQLTLSVQENADGSGVKTIKFMGQGCSISMASASILTEELEGKSWKECEQAIEDFRQVLMDKKPDEVLPGDLKALAGVKKFPVRIKCALLAWTTLRSALEKHGHLSSRSQEAV